MSLDLNSYLTESLQGADKQPKKRKFINIPQGALSLMIDHASRNHAGPVLVISNDPTHTDKFAREINFFNLKTTFLPFFDWETLPYDSFSPNRDIISQRIETLFKLSTNFHNQTITSIALSTALYRLCPKDFIAKHSFFMQTGDKLDLANIKITFVNWGYTHTSQVVNHGEFSIKGSIIDVYPMGSESPYRIDLFDNEIDSIRIFDPESQKTVSKIESINLLPAHEFPLSPEAIKAFRTNWRNTFAGNPTNSHIYKDISDQVVPSGIEYYIPLFFEQMGTIFDYLPANSLIILINTNQLTLEKQIDEFNQSINNRYTNYNIDSRNPLLSPDKLFLRTDEFFNNLNRFNLLELTTQTPETMKSWHAELSIKAIDTQLLNIDHHLKDPLGKLKDFIGKHDQSKILICAESLARQELIIDLLNKHLIKDFLVINNINNWDTFLTENNKLNVTVAKLDNGFHIKALDPNIIVISESELYGELVTQRRLRKHKNIDAQNLIKNLVDLQPDQYIVHELHGVGKYLGLETITVNNLSSEYIKLLYADNAKIYVPVTNLDRISRYSSIEHENVELNKLGSKSWSQAKQKALNKIRDTAAELLNIYAKRAANQGFAYEIDETEYNKFCADFKFEVTPDQNLAIKQVLNDMQSPAVMDRLISGDVGFGKTEVALRAAFVAVSNHKQVAILVPTTLLAQQHFETFCDRFASFAINIDLLSRFRSGAQLSQSIKNIESGKTDIVIGTHKLLQETVKFKDLGLLIVDEEHRFGVGQKEKIKKLRAHVDILNLTATPIPRTLNLALSGIRDLSIITTPPQKRLAIKTFIHDRSRDLIYDAISRELQRGGQVYFLHNNIKTINVVFDEISEMFPESKIAVAHGQMRERELEKIMSDFYHRRYHILICTTIIETGIDVPSANTILIDRADKLGLAQLHQIRGRVGRSHHQAYAYLFTPKDAKISSDATKRLDAISQLEDLGSGFVLASNDMEIRGTGNLLGDEQSGHIEAIGYSLYMDLLNKAVKALKAGEILDFDQLEDESCEVDFKVSAMLPDSYIPDVNQRLILYKRIASVTDLELLSNLKFELADRFGAIPEQVQNLFKVTEIKLKASNIGITKIDVGTASGKIKFNKKPKVNFNTVINLIQTQSQHYKLAGQDVLSFHYAMDTVDQKYSVVNSLIDKLMT